LVELERVARQSFENDLSCCPFAEAFYIEGVF
jgi:hypothetical protein